MVTAPGTKGTGEVGLAGDRVYFREHGGPDQAVYAYAREDLDFWAAELDTPLPRAASSARTSPRPASTSTAR